MGVALFSRSDVPVSIPGQAVPENQNNLDIPSPGMNVSQPSQRRNRSLERHGSILYKNKAVVWMSRGTEPLFTLFRSS
jgi:hypothetical protein